MRKLLAALLLLAAPVGAAPKLLIQPRAVSPIIMPLVRPMTRLPLFDIKFGNPGGGGGGGGSSWGTEPSSNGCVTKTGADAFGYSTFVAGVGMSITNGDCQATTITLGVDQASVDTFASGTGAVPGSGDVGTFYFRTSTPAFYLYPAQNAEHWALTIPAGTSQGDLFYASAADTLAALAKSTSSTRLLCNTGSSNNPAWCQADLTTAVTGTLPATNGGTGQSTATQGDILYASAANTWSKLGAGTSGQFLKTLGAGANPTWADGGGAFDPSTTLNAYCDFVSGLNTTANVCEIGMGTAAISSGTLTQVAGTSTNPGLIRLASASANDNSGDIVYYASSAALTAINSSTWDTKDWSLDAVFIPGTNSGAITNASWYFGLADVITETATNATKGIWIRWNADNSDTTYVFVVCNASGGSGCSSTGDSTNVKTVASTITPVAGTANRLRIRRATSGVGGNPTIYFRVNNETEKTFCSSGCDDTLGTYTAASYVAQVSYYERATGTILSGDLDYFYLNIPGLVRY